MIQCVGPAEDYCSRICCTTALKNAYALKERYPDIEIQIIYKDIRVYGFYESLYTNTRNLGVIMFRYDDDHKPEVFINKQPSDSTRAFNDETSELWVTVHDNTLHKQVILKPDLVVLSMPVIPRSDMKDVANQYKVPIDSDGFFLEAHVKLDR